MRLKRKTIRSAILRNKTWLPALKRGLRSLTYNFPRNILQERLRRQHQSRPPRHHGQRTLLLMCGATVPLVPPVPAGKHTQGRRRAARGDSPAARPAASYPARVIHLSALFRRSRLIAVATSAVATSSAVQIGSTAPYRRCGKGGGERETQRQRARRRRQRRRRRWKKRKVASRCSIGHPSGSGGARYTHAPTPRAKREGTPRLNRGCCVPQGGTAGTRVSVRSSAMLPHRRDDQQQKQLCTGGRTHQRRGISPSGKILRLHCAHRNVERFFLPPSPFPSHHRWLAVAPAGLLCEAAPVSRASSAVLLRMLEGSLRPRCSG